MTITRSSLVRLLVGCAASVALVGGGCAPPASGDEGISEVTFDLQSAPGDASCIALTVTTGGQTSTRLIGSKPGGRSTTTVADLAAGSATFSALAYPVTCDTTPLPAATYSADPVTITITAGTAASVTLSFHRKEKTYVSLDFPTGSLVPRTMTADTTSCAAFTDGTVHCHGYNYDGRIGDGNLGSTQAGALATLRVDAKKIVNGTYHSCALLQDGSMQCWGRNWQNAIQPGNTLAYPPTTVQGIYQATDIAAGTEYTCALSYGYVYCWGDNTYGQLGTGDTGPQYYGPVLVSGLQDVVAISARSYTTCAVTKSGAVYCWGSNQNAETGTAGGDKWTPALVLGVTNVVGISRGDSTTCAITASGGVSCWGRDYNGVFGGGVAGGFKTTPQPLPVTGFFTQIAVGYYHACGLLADGSMRCWGSNNYGQIGDGSAINATIRTPVTLGLGSIVETAAGSYNSCARTISNTIYCWGDDSAGQLGDFHITPTSAPMIPSW